MNNTILKERFELDNFNSNKMNYQDLIDSFINYIDVSENTMITYKRSLKQFWNYMKMRNIQFPTRENIIEFKEYLLENNKPNTANLYLASVKNFYKWLEYMGITKDISKNIKCVKMAKNHLKRGLTQEEIKLVLDNCSNIREELLIKLMITCALRENEVVNIRLEDFYEEYGTILLKVLGKGRNGIKQDIVKIDHRIFELVKKYCKEYNIKDYLFTSTSNNNKDGKLNTITIRRIVTNLFKKANLNTEKLSTHSTRHSAVEIALQSGMSIQEVSEMVRHSSISTTMIYSKEIKQRESQFANILTDAIMG